MIDSIWVPTSVHFIFGTITVLATLLAFAAGVVSAVRKAALPLWGHVAFIVAQVALAVQVLIGIKLLDQGLGPMQLYVHYLGGTGALFFFLLYYWLPERVRQGRWTAAVLSGMAFLFTMMAFGIGESYDPTEAARLVPYLFG